jgi:hypothetical protein
MAQKPSDNSNSVKTAKQFKFPDIYLPADVARAVCDKTITPTGFTILMVVRALTISKKWCWARNGYFANACGRSSLDKIITNISSLIDQGFLLKKWKGKKRYLRLAWSWSIPKRVSVNTQKGISQNTQKGIHEAKEVEAKEAKGDTPPASKNGVYHYSPSAKAAHIQLRTALKASDRITGNRPGSVQAFARLEAKKIEYQPALDWLCRHCSKEDQDKLGLPSVIDGVDFCSPKILAWIEDCRRNSGKDARKRKERNELAPEDQW